MSNLVRVLFVFLLGLMAVCVNAQVVAYTPTQITQIVTTSFQKDDFATLDKMATQFLTSKSRSSSGTWNLAIFQSNLRNVMYEGREENSEAQWQHIEEKISRWIATSPKSTSAPIVLAWAQLRHGWSYRGTGYAGNVTAEGGGQFARYVSMSAKTLEKYKNVSSVNPEWHVLMLTLAKHRQLKEGEYELLYEEAVKAEPTYHGTYLTVAQTLQPKWGGSVEKINAFAHDAVLRTNSTEGSALYARIFWSVSDETNGMWKQIEATGGWPLMKSGFEDMIKQYPAAWNKNAYAKFSCRAGDVDTFIRLAREFGGKPMADAWPRNFFQQCKDYAVKMRPESPI